MPAFNCYSTRHAKSGHRWWLKCWRYPGVPIPARLSLKYEVKVADIAAR